MVVRVEVNPSIPGIDIGGGSSTPNIPARGTLAHAQYLQDQLRLLQNYPESEP